MKIKRNLIVGTLCLVGIVPIKWISPLNLNQLAWADEPVITDSTDAQKATVKLAIEKFGITPMVDKNGIINAIGGIEHGIIMEISDPLEAVYRFFEENGSFFGLDNPREELIVRDNVRSRNGYGHLGFVQKIDEIDAENSFYKIDFRVLPDSQSIDLISIAGHIFPEARNLNLIPSISSAQAESLAINDPVHNGAEAAVGAKTHLLVSEINDALHLVWRVNIMNGGYGGSASYWIDAHDGTILKAATAMR
jgi:hypothetical protein